jgi:hypothetical protein
VGVLSAEKANAMISVTATEVGPNVVFSYTGSITDFNNLGSSSSGINGVGAFNAEPTGGAFFDIGSGNFDLYPNIPVNGPTGFGSNNTTVFANSNTGSYFALFVGTSLGLIVPDGYTAGTTISGTSTYNSATLASLGITPGTYIWTLGNTARDTITLNATPVPLESDALPIVGSVVFMAGGLWFKRRRAQAKANLEFLTADQEK